MENILVPIICAVVGSTAFFQFIQFLITRRDNKKLKEGQKRISDENQALSRESKMQSARSDILQMMLEDRINVAYGELPPNYQAIHTAFDDYLANGGNSYLVKKVKEYDDWYDQISNQFHGGLS